MDKIITDKMHWLYFNRKFLELIKIFEFYKNFCLKYQTFFIEKKFSKIFNGFEYEIL